MVRGAPGTGKTVFAATFIYEGVLRYGEPGVYASLGEGREKFYEFMRGFGMDFERLEDEGSFKFLSMPTLLEAGVGGIFNEIIEAVESLGARRLVIDSFTALSQGFKSGAEARVFLHTLLSDVMGRLGCTTILIKEELAEARSYGFEDYVTDALICLRAARHEDRFLREMTLAKVRGSRIRHLDILVSLHQASRPFHLGGR